jgi:pantoate--beta-alanine ligase
MADDLNLPVEVVGCPIVREPDGLALSSRNAYLAPSDRQAALVLSRALRAAVDAIVAGERDALAIERVVHDTVAEEPHVALEYAEIRDAHELSRMGTLDGSVLVAVAARVGATRLIDNVFIRIDDSGVTADLGVLSTTAP